MASIPALQAIRQLKGPGLACNASPPTSVNDNGTQAVKFQNSGITATSSCSRLSAASRRATGLLRSQTPFPPLAPLLCSSSSASVPAAVEEGESSADGTRSADGRPLKALSQEELVNEAVRRLSEDDLEMAVRKYNLEEELFRKVDFAQVNAFTHRPFSGNPAAVCYLPYIPDDRWLQMIAREFNLSETAFVVKRQPASKGAEEEGSEGGKDTEEDEQKEGVEFDLRWFTPKVEVDLCGHATLASAHIIFSAGIVEGNAIVFHTRSGVLRATKVRGYDGEEEDDEASAANAAAEGGDAEQQQQQVAGKKKPSASSRGVVELDFPISTAQECAAEQAKALTEALGVDAVWVGATTLGDFLVELPSSEAVRAVRPQLHLLRDLPGRGGVIVTARAGAGDASSGPDGDVDFVSRFFCPKAGIDEDPVTGSAHCVLGWYWTRKLGKSRLEAYQASERGGRVSVRVEEQEGRVYLQGGAVLVMAGSILDSLRALD